uniref:WW domain-containing protein n=1 Tax=Cacopsylla melanoneura TaxID=428564 RepID=A0A8D8SIW0_9HEMI
MKVDKDSTDNIDGCNVDEFSSLLKSKLSCLCAHEKKQESTLFRIKIQLETLYTAWTEQALSVNYLLSTCTQISKRLKSLEQENLPLGWLAKWDATQSKYYYVNDKENLKQYYYPTVSEGEEDMDLCTTPPHSPLGPKDCGVVVAPPIPGVEDSPPPPPPPTSPLPPPLPPLPPSQPPLPKPPPPSYSPPSIVPPPPSYAPKQVPPPPNYAPKKVPPPPSSAPKKAPPPPSYAPKKVPPPPSYSPTIVPPPPSYSPTGVPPPPPSYPSPGVPPPPPIYSTAGVPPPPPSYSPTPALEAKYPTAGPTPPPPPSMAFARPVSPVAVLSPKVNKTPQDNTLLSELDSFYSDIASMAESPAPQYSNSPQPPLPPSLNKPEPPSEPPLPTPSTSTAQTAVTTVKKKKKTTKVAPVLSMKKKNVSSLVAKWQQVQNDLS